MASDGPTLQPSNVNVAVVLLVGMPFVCVFALALHALFYMAGYRYHPGRLPIPTLAAVIVGTRVLVTLREKWSTPSRRVWYAALISWAVLAVALWARVTNRLPPDL